MVDLVRLEELAKAATPGPWKQHLVDDTTVICPQRDICCTFAEGGLNDDVDFSSDTEQREADAAFIAAANPATILELLAEIERLRGRNGKLRILASYIAGTNDDKIRVALAGNPIACDSLISLAAALIREQEE